MPFFLKDHENVIYSNITEDKFANVKVANCLLYEALDYDITFFLLEDNIDSSFCYDFSVLTPGIRIFLDNTFNNLKFERYSHISNGIVYDQLLAEEGFNSAISIGGYHMRGWSLEPYQRLYPFYFAPVEHGVDVLTRSCFERSIQSPSFYLPFPLSFVEQQTDNQEFHITIFSDSVLFDRYFLASEVIHELQKEGYKISVNRQDSATRACLGLVLRTLNQRSIPRAALLAAEKGLAMIFFSECDHFRQLVLTPGLAEKERLKAAIKQFVNDRRLLSCYRKALKDGMQDHSAQNIYNQLMDIVEKNLVLIKKQVIAKSQNNKLEQAKLIKSALLNLADDFAAQLTMRFDLSV